MGAISGTVTDATGAAVNNVTVVITGTALMGPRTSSTNEDGYYRFAAVVPGIYRIEFRLEGFAEIRRDDVHVAIGSTATVDESIPIAAVRETVDVVPQAPVVDTHSAVMSVNFEASHLANMPGSRSMFAILSATPGVYVARFEVGGGSGDAGSPYSAYGTRGANRPTVEGINVSGIFPTGFLLNFGSFDEVSVLTGANTAEWQSPGVHMQFVSKSGGNQYRGTVYADYENRAWQSVNIDDDQIRRGDRAGALPPDQANRLWSYHDVNADLGGYIKQDLLWWYFAFREQSVSARQVNFAAEPLRTNVINYSGKATYQFNEGNRLVAFGQAGRNHQPTRLDPFAPAGGALNASTAINDSVLATSEQIAWGWVWKGEWNSVIKNALFLEARAGGFGSNRPERPRGADPRFEDVVTLAVHGGNRDWEEDLRRYQFTTSLSYFKDGWLGSHQFKLGTDTVRTLSSEIWRRSYAGDVLHVLRNGAPSEVYLFETPSHSESGLFMAAGHVTDSWRVNNRLTLNLGMRFDRIRVFLPEQAHPASRFNPAALSFRAVDDVRHWNEWVARVSAVYDFKGDGKTIAKFSYGTYVSPPGTELGFNVNPNARVWWRRHEWKDGDGSGVWESGEEMRLIDRRGGIAVESIDPNLQLPLLREAAGWIERALPGGVSVRSGVVWRTEGQHFARRNASLPFEAFRVPITIADPGPDGAPNTPDDGPGIPGFTVAPEFLGLPPSNIVSNVPNSDSRHWTWDINANKRLSRGWSLMAGFGYTWNGDQAAGYSGQSVRNNVYAVTPNDLFHAGRDGRYDFTTWTAKALVTWQAPWAIQVTPSIRHQSGQPFGRTFSTVLNYGGVRVLAEPLGTRRMDNMTLVDARIEKSFALPGSRRFAGFVDLFNLFNANPEQNTNWSSGAFLRPLNIVPPRIMRLGVKLDW